MRAVLLAAATLAAGFGWIVPATAQNRWNWETSPRVVEDRLTVELGALWAGFETTARVDEVPEEPGTVFSAEDDFGVEDTKFLVAPELTLLPGRRHLIRFSGLRISRSGTNVLDRDILFDGELYEEGDTVDAEFELNMFGLSYGYRFLQRDRYRLAATLGVQVIDTSNRADVQGFGFSTPTGETVPVPLIGLEGSFDVSSRWSLDLRVQYTSIEIDLVDGSVMDARVAATWRMNPHVIFGLGYRTLQIDAESLEEDSAGLLDFRMQGPTLFVRASL